MVWSLIDRKVMGVRAQLNGWELQSLEREFVETTNRISSLSRMSKTAAGCLFVDLVYAIGQHRDWLQTPVFSVLLVEFLQFDHGITRNDAEVIVHDLLDAAIQLGLGRARSLCSQDRDFLTAAYVSAAGAVDDSNLEIELGLGSAVLRKLRDGIKALESVDQNVFVPEYDAMLASIVLELSQEVKQTPWSMDLYKLKFGLLSAGGDLAQPFILPESLPVILDALVAIGRGNAFTLNERPALAELLVKASLLVESKPNVRSKKSRYVITDLGARLTGAKVAATTQERLSLDDFLKLNNYWQISFVKRSKLIDIQFLSHVAIGSINRLSPDVIEAIVGRMLELNTGLIEPQVVKAMLASSQMDWHKSAVIRSIRLGTPSPDLLKIVAGEVTSSTSPGVRLAASALLDAWTDKASFV